ncbi:hypothetical protein [Lactiplantibacillus daowaiensis]|uniref:Phosphoribulokinase/uridine kinase domain-containing protein n=1 Tax=Lactiplantibacillus daowaiensis TaxID=2559918 RepID=A0ABW1S447_9LACO|nr:hypothetical protein [Lactiplantibacillus daowaiensis]
MTNIKTALLTKIIPNPTGNRPVVLGITGSVASGKTTLARQIQRQYQQLRPDLTCVLVSTDDFLWSNAVLKQRQLCIKKGFPVSYDHHLMARFVTAIQQGQAITLPTYNHATNDLDQQLRQVIYQPDVLIIEGLMVLQPTLRQLLTTSLFLAVDPTLNYQWYLQRCEKLDLAAKYGQTWAEFEPIARKNWVAINQRNFDENVAPLQALATWQARVVAGHRLAWIAPTATTTVAQPNLLVSEQ